MTTHKPSPHPQDGANTNNNNHGRPETSGSYILTFWLAGREYGLLISTVVQIIDMVALTDLPQAPLAVQGVINVRGQLVPVLDLRLRFGLPFQAYQLHTPIILIDLDGWLLGVIVDQVEAVLEVPAADLDTKETFLPPELTGAPGLAANGSYLYGAAKVGPRPVPILKLEAILTAAEEQQLREALSDPEAIGATA